MSCVIQYGATAFPFHYLGLQMNAIVGQTEVPLLTRERQSCFFNCSRHTQHNISYTQTEAQNSVDSVLVSSIVVLSKNDAICHNRCAMTSQLQARQRRLISYIMSASAGRLPSCETKQMCIAVARRAIAMRLVLLTNRPLVRQKHIHIQQVSVDCGRTTVRETDR